MKALGQREKENLYMYIYIYLYTYIYISYIFKNSHTIYDFPVQANSTKMFGALNKTSEK